MPAPSDPALRAAWRKKISTSAKEAGVGKWMLGKHLSAESRKRLSESQLALKKTITLEHRFALARARKAEVEEGKDLFGGAEGRARAITTTVDQRRGKTYEEIYGERADDERLKRMEGNLRRFEGVPRKLPRHRSLGSDPIYKDWRRRIYTRDDYTCQACGVRGGKLHAHHIRSWAEFPQLRYDIDNGMTLHQTCHKALHSQLLCILQRLT